MAKGEGVPGNCVIKPFVILGKAPRNFNIVFFLPKQSLERCRPSVGSPSGPKWVRARATVLCRQPLSIRNSASPSPSPLLYLSPPTEEKFISALSLLTETCHKQSSNNTLLFGTTRSQVSSELRPPANQVIAAKLSFPLVSSSL